MYGCIQNNKTADVNSGSTITFRFFRRYPSAMSFVVVVNGGPVEVFMTISNCDDGSMAVKLDGKGVFDASGTLFREIGERELPVAVINVHVHHLRSQNGKKSEPVSFSIYALQWMEQPDEIDPSR